MKDMEEKIAELNKKKEEMEEMEEKLEKEKGEIAQELQLLKLKLEETLEEEFRCPTCRDIFISPVSLNCGHSICKFCLEKGKILDHDTCPECREVIVHENRVLAMDNITDAIMKQLGEDKVKERQENVKQRTGTYGFWCY